MEVLSGGASFLTWSSMTLESLEAELWLWMARSTDMLMTCWELREAVVLLALPVLLVLWLLEVMAPPWGQCKLGHYFNYFPLVT